MLNFEYPKITQYFSRFSLLPRRKQFFIGLTVIFFLVFGAVHLKLISDTFYVDADNNFRANSQGGYGDTPMHMTIISKFAFSNHFDLNQPIYYGSKMRYHFFIDMFRGWLLKLTGAWSESILWPIYILAIANTILVFLIYRRFLKNSALVVVAFLVFFLGTGTGGWGVLVGRPLGTILDFNARYPNQNVVFGPILSMSFTYQHAFFLGLFFFLLLFWFLLAVKDRPKKLYVVGAGIALGVLPLSHTHSFVAACVFLLIMLLFHLGKADRPYLKRLLTVGFIGLLLALPQISFILGTNSSVQSVNSFSHFRLGWMVPPGVGAVQFPTEARSAFSVPFLSFLWKNFGVILPVMLVCAAALFIFMRKMGKEDFRKTAMLLAAGSALFLLVQTVNFQPWDFDNNRILVYFLFMAAPFMTWIIFYTFRSRRLLQFSVLGFFLFASVFSGMTEAAYLLQTRKKDLPVIFDTSAQNMARFIRNNVSEDKLVLTGTNHLNPVSSLAGRQILVGYPGWLWSQENIDYSTREQEIKRFYQAPSVNSAILKEYPIGYVMVDNSVERDYKAVPADFDRLFKREYQAGDYILYSL